MSGNKQAYSTGILLRGTCACCDTPWIVEWPTHALWLFCGNCMGRIYPSQILMALYKYRPGKGKDYNDLYQNVLVGIEQLYKGSADPYRLTAELNELKKNIEAKIESLADGMEILEHG